MLKIEKKVILKIKIWYYFVYYHFFLLFYYHFEIFPFRHAQHSDGVARTVKLLSIYVTKVISIINISKNATSFGTDNQWFGNILYKTGEKWPSLSISASKMGLPLVVGTPVFCTSISVALCVNCLVKKLGNIFVSNIHFWDENWINFSHLFVGSRESTEFHNISVWFYVLFLCLIFLKLN